MCDQSPDCRDGSDEAMCSKLTHLPCPYTFLYIICPHIIYYIYLYKLNLNCMLNVTVLVALALVLYVHMYVYVF